MSQSISSSQTLFSVIVPIYNISKLLHVCIQSILKQTYSNFELILVDDGSTDDSSQICDHYLRVDRRVKVIHKENGGLVSSRQAGLQVSTGDYIVCVDGDDWVSINYLQKFAECISCSSPDIICCGAIWEYETKSVMKPILKYSGFYDKPRIIKEIFPDLIENDKSNYFPPSIWAKAYKKELYKKFQMLVNTSIKIGEDHVCVKPCIFNSNSLHIISDCLYHYRQNPLSMTKVRKPFAWDGPYLILEQFQKSLPISEFDLLPQLYRNFSHNLFNVAVSQFNSTNAYRLTKTDIIKHLNDSLTSSLINKTEYSFINFKGQLVKVALKYKLIILLKIYSKMK